jgi:hypothetical protein
MRKEKSVIAEAEVTQEEVARIEDLMEETKESDLDQQVRPKMRMVRILSLKIQI